MVLYQHSDLSYLSTSNPWSNEVSNVKEEAEKMDDQLEHKERAKNPVNWSDNA